MQPEGGQLVEQLQEELRQTAQVGAARDWPCARSAGREEGGVW